MKILLFGGSGQLGLEVQKRAEDLNFALVSPVISEIDITDLAQLRFLVKQVKPDLIINSAAYTNVDKAESESAEAFAINAEGAKNVALAAADSRTRLFHISTDFVFGDSITRPLVETDPTEPLSVYGKSKFEGEKNIMSVLSDNYLIIRTSSLHGRHGNNFVHRMLELFAQREELSIVSDRFMSATWAGWLAEVLLDLARIPSSGILHASCEGALSWFDFAAEILELARPKIPNAAKLKLLPVSGDAFPLPAKRPKYSVLDCSKLAGLLGRKPISWRLGLRAHLKELGYL